MQQIVQERFIKIQAKGVVTIPKKLRQGLFADNDLVKIKKEKGRLVIEPVRTLPYPVRSYTEREIKEFLAFDKEEKRQLKKQGLSK